MLNKDNFWSTPVPYFETKVETSIAILAFAGFVSGFLLFFQPFGVNNYDPSESISKKLLIGIGSFGLVIILVLLSNELILRRKIVRNVTRLSGLIWSLWTLVLLSSSLYIHYNILGNWHDWNVRSYLNFMVNVSAISLIPYLIFLFYLRQKSLRRQLLDLTTNFSKTKRGSTYVTLRADNATEIILAIDKIFYLESLDNYVQIHYEEDEVLQRHMLRGTLKRLAAELEGTPLVQCHRAYLVNILKVKDYEGNAHRMKLILDRIESFIPVSRNYTKVIRSCLSDDPWQSIPNDGI